MTVELEPGMSYFEILKYCDKLSRSNQIRIKNHNRTFLNGLGLSSPHTVKNNSKLNYNNFQGIYAAAAAALVQSGGEQGIKKMVILG
jgi:ammonia channel protein AmtB